MWETIIHFYSQILGTFFFTEINNSLLLASLLLFCPSLDFSFLFPLDTELGLQVGGLMSTASSLTFLPISALQFLDSIESSCKKKILNKSVLIAIEKAERKIWNE